MRISIWVSCTLRSTEAVRSGQNSPVREYYMVRSSTLNDLIPLPSIHFFLWDQIFAQESNIDLEHGTCKVFTLKFKQIL